MKIAAVVHGYPPTHNAGAEWTIHELLLVLKARGHEPTVYCPRSPAPFEGIDVRPLPTDLRAALSDADLVMTHLDLTGRVVAAADRVRKPVVHLLHNHRQLGYHKVKPGPRVLAVANSEWIAKSVDKAFRVVTCHPIVPPERYEIPVTSSSERSMVTLVNVQAAKGSARFVQLAKEFPRLSFLGVRGSYGVQDEIDLDNVEMIDTTPDIVGDVYARTRVLLMPSAYESWGRVAIEGACSGIPTIAAPTEGLLESLGRTGMFARTPQDWARQLLPLFHDGDAYQRASDTARARASELYASVPAQLDHLEEALDDLVSVKARPARVTGPDPVPEPLRAAPTVAVVVPWQPDVSRAPIWSWIRAELWETHFPDWLLVEATSEAGFEKPVVLNQAISQLAAEVIVVADADVLVSPSALVEAAEAVQDGGWATCHKLCYRLTPETTAVLLDGPWTDRVHSVPRDQVIRAPMGPTPGGGLFVIARKSWEELGGMDERFVGPGGQDMAFGMAADTLLGGHKTTGDVMWHLWHVPGARQGARFAANVKLVGRYRHAAWDKRRMVSLLAER